MARLTQTADADASPETARLFDAIRTKIGMVPNLYRVAGARPAVLSALLGLGEALSRGRFDARTREAIALAVAGANACDYCASAHAAIATGLKVAEADIARHLEGRAEDPRLAAILTLAVRIVETRGLLGDGEIDAARAAGLDDGDIAEVVGHVTHNLFTNYLNHVAGTEIDFPARRARPARAA